MGIIQKLTRFIYAKNEITYSKVSMVFTKYGRYNIKAYKDKNKEYLAIMSTNFPALKSAIVYIHSEEHSCMPHDEGTCLCNNQMEMALKMISKSGGLILFHSANAQNIDGLLHEINTSKLARKEEENSKTTVKFDMSDKIAYPSLGFIFQDLKLEQIRLITHDLKIVNTIDLLGIKILKREAGISFKYGLR